MFARSISVAVFVVLATFGSSAGFAQQAPSSPGSAAAEHAHDGGIIAGKISSVDYRRNVMTVNKTSISVMPSTQIQGSDPAYHAITDLKPGMTVAVYTSQIAGRYIAQIITLK